MIDSQVMGLEAVHLMEKEALMEQDQLGLQAMALDQTVGIPALVLLTDPEAQEMVAEVTEEHLMETGDGSTGTGSTGTSGDGVGSHGGETRGGSSDGFRKLRRR